MSKRVLIVAGEASGDQHGAALVRSVKSLDASIQFLAMGGDHLRQAGVDVIVDAKPLAVVGAIEVLQHWRPIYRAYRTLSELIAKNPPDLIVLIDYPAFNLQIARIAKRAGIRVLYYISPQIWAWRQGRVKTIKRRVDKMLVVFPFEEAFYQREGVSVEYVGHPLAQKVVPDQPPSEVREQWHFSPTHRLIALLPGSRIGEIRRLLPTLLETAQALHQKYTDTIFVLPVASSLSVDDLKPYLTAVDFPIVMIADQSQHYNVLQLCEAAIVTSGTATLEVALLGIPMVIVYKVAASTYHIGKYLIRVPYIGLCNIVAGRLLVKELIQHEANPNNISAEIGRILDDPTYQAQLKTDLREVAVQLGSGGGSLRAARALLNLLT